MATLDNLWSGLQNAGHASPYMLIDCAGIDGGEARIPRDAFAELQCLFTGDLAVELANVGPYLGRLKSFAPDVRAVAQDLLDKHVAMLVLLPAIDSDQPAPSFAHVHRHFRKFNVVYDPDGKPLFFRYYDPRVLVDVLTVLSGAQLDSFFGPVEALVLVDAAGQVTRCQRQAGRLAVLA